MEEGTDGGRGGAISGGVSIPVEMTGLLDNGFNDAGAVISHRLKCMHTRLASFPASSPMSEGANAMKTSTIVHKGREPGTKAKSYLACTNTVKSMQSIYHTI